MKRAALYLRVSTSTKTARVGVGETFDQRPEVQEEPLRQMATHRGWTVVGVFVDRVSGAVERRPGLDEMMKLARRGQFDVVMVWRFDRFARSTHHLVEALQEFQSLGIDFVSHQEVIDTCTPMGRAMFAVVAAIAQLERELIAERVRAGLEHARKHGTRSGRQIGRPRVVVDRQRVADLRRDGASWREIARQLGAGVGTVRRLYAGSRRAGGVPKPLTDERDAQG